MISYLVHDHNGTILRTGYCSVRDFPMQANSADETVLFAIADDERHKVVAGEIIDRSPEEIEARRPKVAEVPESERPARITQGELDALLSRIKALEIGGAK